MSKPGQMIPPDAYPQPVSKADAAAMARQLRSTGTIDDGAVAIKSQGGRLLLAVQELVNDLEKVRHDHAKVAAAAHEIRGLAQSAGLQATGVIANGLYRYLDDVEQLGLGPDAAIVNLHVQAILRATRGGEPAALSDAVAQELAGLVSRKLTDVKNLLAGPVPPFIAL